MEQIQGQYNQANLRHKGRERFQGLALVLVSEGDYSHGLNWSQCVPAAAQRGSWAHRDAEQREEMAQFSSDPCAPWQGPSKGGGKGPAVLSILGRGVPP